ncbi:MAG: CDP-alcohol phosphatidyltransferase family protein, partial [Desulfobacterales bacterium]
MTDERQGANLPARQGRLLVEWWTATLCTLVLVLMAFVILREACHPRFAWRWLCQTTWPAFYVLGRLRSGLQANYHPQTKVWRPQLGLATWITLLRGILIAMLAGFILQPWPPSDLPPLWLIWAPGLLYLAAAVLDYGDGLIARIRHHETRLGERLDLEIDALGLLIASFL